jgi:hypothetical protein
MPPNVAERLDNSVMEVTFDKFVNYLLAEEFISKNSKLNLSLEQVKTIYNLNFKHSEVRNALNNAFKKISSSQNLQICFITRLNRSVLTRVDGQLICLKLTTSLKRWIQPDKSK